MKPTRSMWVGAVLILLGVIALIVLILSALFGTSAGIPQEQPPISDVTPTPAGTATPTPVPPICPISGYPAVQGYNETQGFYWDCTGNVTATPSITPTPLPTVTPTRTIDEQMASWTEEGNSATPLLIEDATNGFLVLVQLCCGSFIILILLALLAVVLGKKAAPRIRKYTSGSTADENSAAAEHTAASHAYSFRSEEEPLPPGFMAFSLPPRWKRPIAALFSKETKWTYFFISGGNNPEADKMDLTDRWEMFGKDLLQGTMSNVTEIKASDEPGALLEMMGLARYMVRKDTGTTLILLETGGSLFNRIFRRNLVCRWPNADPQSNGWYNATASLREALWWRMLQAQKLKRIREAREEAAVTSTASIAAPPAQPPHPSPQAGSASTGNTDDEYVPLPFRPE